MGRKSDLPFLAAAAAIAIILFSRDAAASIASIAPVSTARIAEGTIVALSLPWIARAGFAAPATALALIAAGRTVVAVGAFYPPSTELVWGFDYLLSIVGLALLAVERESQRASLRFFLRLNLTFVILASSLVLVVMQIERRHSFDMAALHAQDLAEFVRGHMLYYSARGDPPESNKP